MYKLQCSGKPNWEQTSKVQRTPWLLSFPFSFFQLFSWVVPFAGPRALQARTGPLISHTFPFYCIFFYSLFPRALYKKKMHSFKPTRFRLRPPTNVPPHPAGPSIRHKRTKMRLHPRPSNLSAHPIPRQSLYPGITGGVLHKLDCQEYLKKSSEIKIKNRPTAQWKVLYPPLFIYHGIPYPEHLWISFPAHDTHTRQASGAYYLSSSILDW